MTQMKTWTWQTWAIIGMGGMILLGQIVGLVRFGNEWRQTSAHLSLPKTVDFMQVSYVDLERSADEHLVVYTDAHAVKTFTGRYRVVLRDRDTYRHVWTPEWSEWIEYVANPLGTRYRQPETLQWWANYDQFVEPPAHSWAMETCWQALYEDPLLGPVELEPVCIQSFIDAAPLLPDYF